MLDVYYGIQLARTQSENAKCKRRKCGCAIVRHPNTQEAKILAYGWNHPLDNVECIECVREKMQIKPGTGYELCRTIHAEQHAIAKAARAGIELSGATMYLTGCPCSTCARMIVESGIKKLVIDMKGFEKLPGVIEMLTANGVEVGVF